MDLFKAIFAESSEESALSSDESDTDNIVAVSANKPDSPPNDINKLTLSSRSGSQWQDLSVVTGYLVDQNAADVDTTATISVAIQDHEKRKPSGSGESGKHRDQQLETYGPSLPPGIYLVLWLICHCSYSSIS